jgi:hypothetical protein
MSYKVGNAKSLDDIILKDALEYPIWEWALGEENVPGQDETWQRPITSTTDVTDEMVQPTITVIIKDTSIYGSAEYNRDNDTLESMTIWHEDEWISVFDYESFEFSVIFVAIPSIKGLQGAEFEYSNWQMEIAKRIT